MATMSSIFTAAVILAAFLAISAAVFYLYKSLHGGVSGIFSAPRIRRLAFIEGARLDGGRKLLLVRRDGVEHLILIGGPIDLVVESGILPEPVPQPEVREIPADLNRLSSEPSGDWRDRDLPLTSHLEVPLSAEGRQATSPKPGVPVEPRLSLAPNKGQGAEDMLELTIVHEAKAVQ